MFGNGFLTIRRVKRRVAMMMQKTMKAITLCALVLGGSTGMADVLLLQDTFDTVNAQDINTTNLFIP